MLEQKRFVHKVQPPDAVDDEAFYWLPGFLKHQRIDKPQPCDIESRMRSHGLLDGAGIPLTWLAIVKRIPGAVRRTAEPKLDDMLFVLHREWLASLPQATLLDSMARKLLNYTTRMGADPRWYIQHVDATVRDPVAYIIQLMHEEVRPTGPECRVWTWAEWVQYVAEQTTKDGTK